MRNILLCVVLFFVSFIQSGCSRLNTNSSLKENQETGVSSQKVSNKNITFSSSSHTVKNQVNDNLTQCHRELAALEQFDHASWARSRSEFEKITKSSAAYMEVADTISNDINDMVRPKYQYALRSFCWRVRNDLLYALAHQVKINDSNR